MGRLCARFAAPVADAARHGKRVLVSGACCSHAVGIIGGLQQALGAGARIGVVWLDAHGDFNTPQTTVSGGLFGMPLAVCAGLGLPRWRERAGLQAPIPTDRIILSDGRSLDPLERSLLAATAVRVTACGSQRAGPHFEQALHDLAGRVDALVLHIDTDVLDPVFIPTVHLGEPDGPSLDDVCEVIEITMATGRVAVFNMASVRNFGLGRDVSVASAAALIRAGLRAWK